ncbi:MAG: bifunctional riboflavin kinase/FAD synthetase [Thermoanaerobaculum sp.]|nr:bifunctional riboflavin kinase/FAD synthetase [Thermoanaerobaculum sp.]
MEVLRDPSPWSELPRGGVVSVGNFDGVHRGHQELLRGAVARARERGVSAVGVTFWPHPERVLRPESELRLLTTRQQRVQLLARMGLDVLVELTFTKDFAATPPEHFAREFLFARLRPCEVHLGLNFRFGQGRQGDVGFLQTLGEELGFAVVGMPPLEDDLGPISSSRIRGLVASGAVEQAAQLLQRFYFVDGQVSVGKRLGRRLGFPTLNVEPENELLPGKGVYITACFIPSFSRLFGGVTNVGVRPTLYENHRLIVETHLLDFTADLYREAVRLFFLKRLRDERRFPNVLALSAQVRQDVAQARAFFAAGFPEELCLLP